MELGNFSKLSTGVHVYVSGSGCEVATTSKTKQGSVTSYSVLQGRHDADSIALDRHSHHPITLDFPRTAPIRFSLGVLNPQNHPIE
jgi:hypothetical protein